VGSRANAEWPFFHLTPLGQQVLQKGAPHHLDPDGYLAFLRTLVPAADSIVVQYVYEATRAYRANLDFAAAVMLGAAAERAILQLLEAIRDWQPDPKAKARQSRLLARPRQPLVFSEVHNTVKELADADRMPYATHQGAITHLLSLFEMVRVQRNEAVHPQVTAVAREKVFLSLQTFPVAYQVTERVRAFF
jgi:hypothetical protein